MAFEITYEDEPGLTVYANLFSSTDFSKAWNPSAGDFAAYTLANQSDFALLLVEDSERTGWYTYTISDTTNIPAATDDHYYFIEVRYKSGANYDRVADAVLGSVASYWGMVTDCGDSGNGGNPGTGGATAEEIWSYTNRTLTEPMPTTLTPKEIWEYAARTLTECPCSVEEFQAAILEAIAALTVKVEEGDQTINTHIDQTEIDIINALTPKPLPTPNVAKPTVTLNSKGPSSSIRPG